MTARKQVTLYDIAEKCGVSANTVSRVLRGDTRLSDKTIEKVTQTASLMGYVKNRAALALSSGRSKTIAMIVNDISNPYFGHLLREMEIALNHQGYVLIISCVHNDPQQGLKAVQEMASRSVDGIFYLPFLEDHKVVDYMEQIQMPFVLLDREVDGKTADVVRSDDESGGYQAGKYLAELGHSRFLYLHGRGVIESDLQRQRGFIKALKEHSIPEENIRFLSSAEIETYVQEGSLFDHLTPINYSAVVSFTDILAYYVMNELNLHNVRIPQDVSMIGFDHLRSHTPYLPPLTSIAPCSSDFPQTAVNALLNRIQNPDSERHVHVFPVRIYDEGTVAAI